MQIKEFTSHLNRLGSEIEDLWNKENYSLDIFPTIAFEALSKFNISFVPKLEDFPTYMLEQNLPMQSYPDSSFSEFPITLFRNDHFFIDLYFWYNSDTSIHNHHFSGAFKLLKGSSLQFDYEFINVNKIDETLFMGDLNLKETHRLSPGSVQRIHPQDEFIHRVHHSEKPTVTLCVRTPDLENQNLSSFFPPHYKVLIRDMNQTQRKWFSAIKNILLYHEFDESMLDQCPLLAGDILRLLINPDSKATSSTEIKDLLLKYLKKKGIAQNFLDDLLLNYKLDHKLKAFDKGLIK